MGGEVTEKRRERKERKLNIKISTLKHFVLFVKCSTYGLLVTQAAKLQQQGSKLSV